MEIPLSAHNCSPAHHSSALSVFFLFSNRCFAKRKSYQGSPCYHILWYQFTTWRSRCSINFTVSFSAAARSKDRVIFDIIFFSLPACRKLSSLFFQDEAHTGCIDSFTVAVLFFTLVKFFFFHGISTKLECCLSNIFFFLFWTVFFKKIYNSLSWNSTAGIDTTLVACFALPCLPLCFVFLL